MNNNLLFEELKLAENDVNGALYRLSGDEDLYYSLLIDFTRDQTVEKLESALNAEAWDVAFNAAHAIKGLTANLGLTPLYHSIGELVIALREGKLNDIERLFINVKYNYYSLLTTIHLNSGF